MTGVDPRPASLAIRGLGTALPRVALAQADAARIAARHAALPADEERLLTALYRRSGVRRRHLALFDEASAEPRVVFPPARDAADRGPGTAARMARYMEVAPRLAAEASADALREAGADAESITHLVTVSCTGFEAPGVDRALVARLGLSAEVRRTHVGFMGCHGAINGLFVADACLAREPDARVLLCAVELCSLHHAYGFDPERVVPSALFADGAAALVATRAEPADAWRAAAFGSVLIPGSEPDMTWRIGDHGFEMGLSARVPALIETHLRPWMESWLDRAGLALADVGSWAVHPGGPRIVTAVERALELAPEALDASREVLALHGNMSSPTVLFLLERFRAEGRARPCVVLGFGPGLVAEAALLV